MTDNLWCSSGLSCRETCSTAEGPQVEKINTDHNTEQHAEASVGEPDAEDDAEMDTDQSPKNDNDRSKPPLATDDPSIFHVSLVIPESCVGLDLDLLDDTGIMVMAVLGGAAESWNAKADPEHEVRHGDRIMEVNGSRGISRDHLKLIKDEEKLQMSLKRPRITKISGNTTLKSIGLVITYAPDGYTLLIKQVKPGIVEDWNANNPNLAVRKHDRIVEVNGCPGLATELMELVRAEVEHVEITLFCYNI